MAPFPAAHTKLSRQVAARMRHLRAVHNWTREDLAERLAALGIRVEVFTVQSMESGRRKIISIDEAVALAAAFEITLEELISWRCSVCEGKPPAGFKCQSCGAEAPA